MIEEHAIIVAVHPSTTPTTENVDEVTSQTDAATIEVVRKSACGICGKTRGCGNAFWGKMFAHKTPSFKAENAIGAKVGQHVVVGIDEHAVMKTALLLYMAPLVMMFFGAILFSWLFVADVLVLIGAAVGMLVGFVWVKAHTAGRQYYQSHQPRILRFDHVDAQEDIIQFQ